MKYLKFLCLFTLSSQMAFASVSTLDDKTSGNLLAKGQDENRPYARAERVVPGPSEWYDISAPYVLDDSADLSRLRNTGFDKGNISLSNKGIEIKESGDYWASFLAVLQNNDPDPNHNSIIPFLVRNGKFTADSKVITGGIVPMPSLSPKLFTVQGSGILKNLKAGEKISIRVSSALPVTTLLKCVTWSIDLFKLDS